MKTTVLLTLEVVVFHNTDEALRQAVQRMKEGPRMTEIASADGTNDYHYRAMRVIGVEQGQANDHS